MVKKAKQKPLPKGITYRQKEGRYMGRFMYHGETFTTYGSSAREVEKKLKEIRYQVEHDIYFKNDSVTFDAWFSIWIRDYKAPASKAGTVSTYTQNYHAYIKPIFGNKQMSDIRTDHIQRFYNGMSEKYSRNTMEVCRAILNGMYMQAVINEVLQKNPVTNARLPKKNKKKTAFALTEKEQSIFLSYAKESEYYPLYELALSTGMRSGELRGLQWNDIDFKNKIIHISHTLVYYERKTFLDSPKTSSSERDIPMLNNVERLLKKQRSYQSEQRLRMGEWWCTMEGLENLVFTSEDGKPIIHDYFNRDMNKIVKRIRKDEIPFPHITPHTLRHTFATRSIEKGITYKTLEEILGHSNLSTTMDVYAHVLPDTKASELQKLADLFY